MEWFLVTAVAIDKHRHLERDALSASPVKSNFGTRILAVCVLRLSPLHRIVNPAQAMCPLRPAAGLPSITLAQRRDANDAEYTAPRE
jgi:hypothetical protein